MLPTFVERMQLERAETMKDLRDVKLSSSSDNILGHPMQINFIAVVTPHIHSLVLSARLLETGHSSSIWSV